MVTKKNPPCTVVIIKSNLRLQIKIFTSVQCLFWKDYFSRFSRIDQIPKIFIVPLILLSSKNIRIKNRPGTEETDTPWYLPIQSNTLTNANLSYRWYWPFLETFGIKKPQHKSSIQMKRWTSICKSLHPRKLGCSWKIRRIKSRPDHRVYTGFHAR